MQQFFKTNKRIAIVLSAIILAVFAGAGFFFYGKKAHPETVNQTVNQSGLTAEECSAQGGEIINILDDQRAEDLEFRQNHKSDFCKTKAGYLGDIAGLRCPCICCKN